MNFDYYILLMEIRITKEGLPCFDEFSRWALDSGGYDHWHEIVLAHQALTNTVKILKSN
jgi:hypothetical protein